MGFFSRAVLVFLLKESKFMAKSRSQSVNFPGAWALINPLSKCFVFFFKISSLHSFEYSSGVIIFWYLQLKTGFHSNLIFCLFCHRMLDSRDRLGHGEARK